MHFHLPKPLHGWRAFVGEVGIIVIGVLIALGAEQFLEWVHWRNEVADARRALDHEVAYDLGAVQKRQDEAPCIDRRLHAIRVMLAGRSSGLRTAPRSALGQPQLWRPRTDASQAAVAGQVAEHMPLATRLATPSFTAGSNGTRRRRKMKLTPGVSSRRSTIPAAFNPENVAAVRQARSRAQVAADKLNVYLPHIHRRGREARESSQPLSKRHRSPPNALSALCRGGGNAVSAR